MSATRVQGGGTRTVTARPPREGCSCKPDLASGRCCASMRCSCHKNGQGCSESCACAGRPGEAPLCNCAEPKRGISLAVKKEGDNQGRRFFKCQDCDFFQWAGERGACANPNTDAELDQPAKRPKPNGAHDGLFDNAIDLDDEELGGSSARGAGARGRGGGGGRGRGGGGGGGGGGGAPSAPHGGGARGGKGGGGKGGRKKKCDKGAACPYQHEHQHCAEYSHPTGEPPAAGGSGFTAFGGGGQRVGSNGGGGSSGGGGGGFGGGSSSGFSGGGNVLGGGGGGHDEGIECEVCGRLISLATFDLHTSAHERSGELARWQQQQRERMLLAEQEAAYEASLRADQEAEAAEEAKRAQEARAKAEAKAKAKVEAEAAEAAAEAARREEQRQRELTEARRAALQRAAEALQPEPAAAEGALLTTLKVRLPNGQAVVRRFRRTDTAAALFAWLAALEALAALPAWSLALPVGEPPLEGGLLPTEETLEELDLINVTLWVQQDEVP